MLRSGSNYGFSFYTECLLNKLKLLLTISGTYLSGDIPCFSVTWSGIVLTLLLVSIELFRIEFYCFCDGIEAFWATGVKVKSLALTVDISF